MTSHSRDRCARVLQISFALFKEEAQGKPGARFTRVPAPNVHKRNAHEHTGSAEAIRPSLRNGFTVSSVLSPVTGLSCHRRHAEMNSRQLDASVGASGPHDFAVRVPRGSSSRSFASIAPRTQRS